MKIAISFGKKDMDLKIWRLALKNRGFSVNDQIIQMIKADASHKTIKTPSVEPQYVIDVPPIIQLNLSIDEPIAIDNLTRISSRQKAAYIKGLIRKNLCSNSQDKLFKISENTELPSADVEKRSAKKVYKAQSANKPIIKHTRVEDITDDDDETFVTPNLASLSKLAGED